MKNTNLLICLLLIPGLLISQSVWEQQKNGAFGTLMQVAILNSNTAFTTGIYYGPFTLEGVFLQTLDGGKSWERKIHIDNGRLAYRVKLFSEDHLMVMNPDGVFYSSSDVGNTWNQVAKMPMRPNSARYPEIIFIDSLNYLLFMYDDDISHPDTRQFKTTDGGKNWIEISLDRIGDKPSYFVLDKNTFWIAYGTFMKKTTDGGKTWKDADSHFSGPIFFINPLIGWRGGSNPAGFSTIEKTTDGGFKWDSLQSPTTYQKNAGVWSMWFHDENNGVVVTTRGYIFASSNGGQSWDSVYKSPSSFVDLRFYDRKVGWAVGYDGLIVKTTTGGISWIEENAQPNTITLSQNYPNPFSSRTTIPVTIANARSIRARETEISLIVYDLLGREVKSIPLGSLDEGKHEIHLDATGLRNGIYFVKITGSVEAQMMKMCVRR